MDIAIRNCKRNKCKDREENCPAPGSDGLPVQCVGPWVEDKYYFLERYLNASCEARRKFSDNDNAVFIDLFAGPGRCIIKDEKREIPSGGIRALNRDEAPFNEYYFFDISGTNIRALKNRLTTNHKCHIECGDSNTLIESIVQYLLTKPYRYHFAFVDPFGPDGLKFDTLLELAKLKRMDMLINFPIGAIRRNLRRWVDVNDNTILDDFLGTDEWREKVKYTPRSSIFKALIDIYKEQLKSIGYPEEGLILAPSAKNIYSGLPTVSVRNTRGVNLYVLILMSKNPIGQKIWNSVIKIKPGGKKSMF